MHCIFMTFAQCGLSGTSPLALPVKKRAAQTKPRNNDPFVGGQGVDEHTPNKLLAFLNFPSTKNGHLFTKGDHSCVSNTTTTILIRNMDQSLTLRFKKLLLPKLLSLISSDERLTGVEYHQQFDSEIETTNVPTLSLYSYL